MKKYYLVLLAFISVNTYAGDFNRGRACLKFDIFEDYNGPPLSAATGATKSKPYIVKEMGYSCTESTTTSSLFEEKHFSEESYPVDRKPEASESETQTDDNYSDEESDCVDIDEWQKNDQPNCDNDPLMREAVRKSLERVSIEKSSF